MHVEALAVHPDSPERKQTWVNRAPAWNRLLDRSRAQLRGEDVTDPVFFENAGPELPLVSKEPGVHLHWTIPRPFIDADALQYRGTTIPNIYAVIRTLRWGNTFGRGRVWIVESDYLGPSVRDVVRAPPEQRGSPPFPVQREDGTWDVRYLGRCVEMRSYNNDWREREYLPDLTIAGAGDPLFATAYTHSRNVLGMYDAEIVQDAADLLAGTEQEVIADYYVTGWFRYSPDGITDPLWRIRHAVDVAEYLAELGITFDEGTAEVANGLAVSGLVREVRWSPDVQGAMPSEDTGPRVAIGATLGEALATQIATNAAGATDEGIAHIVEAAQYGIAHRLTEHDGACIVEAEIHEHGFVPHESGTLRILRPKQVEVDGVRAPIPAVPDDTIRYLRDAATREHADAVHERNLGRAHRLAYDVGYLTGGEPPGGGPYIGDRSPGRASLRQWVMGPLYEATRTLSEQTVAWRELTGGETDRNLPYWSEGLEDGAGLSEHYEQDDVALPRYWSPQDPVVVLHHPEQLRHHAHDPTHGGVDDEALGGRLATQLTWPEASSRSSVRGDTVLALQSLVESISDDDQVQQSLRSSAERVFDSETPQGIGVGLGQIPVEPELLMIERILRDSVRPQLLEGASVPPQLLPDRTRYGDSWTPLIIEWEVDYHSTYADPGPDDAKEHFAAALSGWTAGETDYRFDGGAQLDAPDVHTLSGRNIVSMLPGELVGDRLEALAEQLDLDEVTTARWKQLGKAIGTQQVYFQALGGLHDQLIQHRDGIQLPLARLSSLRTDEVDPRDQGFFEVLDDLGRGHSGEDVPDQFPDDELPFFPIRSGGMNLRRLWIIDPFGRVARIDDAQARVVVGPSLRAPDTLKSHGHITMPPRLVPPSRLNFRWCDATETELVDAMDTPGRGPVIGWLLANHLDRSMMVYDPLGRLLGSLRATPEHEGVVFARAVGPREVDLEVSEALAAVLERVEGLGSEFDAWLDRIDTSWTVIDEPGSERDASTALLVGRPIALCRARLNLELDVIADDIRPDRLLSGNPPAFLDVEFPVRLGDPRRMGDGLLGWFVDGDERFHLAWEEDTDSPTGALVPGGDLVVRPNPKSPDIGLVLFVDPRSAVHARTPILPTKALRLAAMHTREPMDRMEATFACGPLLAIGDPPALPIPADPHGAWTWMHPIAVGESPRAWHDEVPLQPLDDRARFSAEGLQFQDGWLRWRPSAPPTIGWSKPSPAPLADPYPTIPPPPVDILELPAGTLSVTDMLLLESGPPLPFPYHLSFDRNALHVGKHSRVIMRLGAPPRYHLAHRRITDRDDDAIYIWFLWEDVESDFETDDHQTDTDLGHGAGDSQDREDELARIHYQAMTTLGEAPGIIVSAVVPFDQQWRVGVVRGMLAQGTHHCWLLTPRGGKLDTELGRDGASFELTGIIPRRRGRAILIAQAWMDGRHTDFGYAYLDKRLGEEGEN